MLVMSISVGMPSVTDLAESWEFPYLAVWLLEPRCMIAAFNRESRSSQEWVYWGEKSDLITLYCNVSWVLKLEKNLWYRTKDRGQRSGIGDQVEKRKPAKQTADKNNSFLDSPFTLKIILPAKMLPKTLHNIMCTHALFSVHNHYSSLKPSDNKAS